MPTGRKINWRPDEPARDVIYRKMHDRLAAQDGCITFLLVELRALQKRVEKLEKARARSLTPKITHWMGSLLEWVNAPVYERGRIRVTRIDVLIVVVGMLCTGYYWWTSGWMGALQGGLLYVMMVMIALWLL